MTKEGDKYINVIAKLVKLTQKGKLKWESLYDPETIAASPDERIESAFVTQYKTRTLRIFKKRYKVNLTSSVAMTFLSFSTSHERGPIWSTTIILQMIDEKGLVLWTFPEVEPIEDLFAAVQYQVADIKGFTEDVLSEN